MTRFKTLRTALMMTAATFGGAFVATLPDRPAYAQQAVRTYAIPAQDLDGALRAFAMQTGRDVLYPPAIVAGKRSPGVQGSRTEDQALTALLAGTGLRFERTTSGGYAVQDPAVPARAGEAGGEAGGEGVAVNLEEVVVTGTRIRGQAPVGSPVLVFRQEDFQNAGADTIQEFMTTVTQATGSSFSADQRTVQGQQTNMTYGSGIDLRGLGPGTTLILLNGRRMAPSGGAANVDVSMIPLSGVQEIQILTDGASALYGSDAIGGVVNIIMRENYTGAQTMASVAIPTRGGGEERRFAQSFGAGWDGGSAFVNVEVSERDPIKGRDRQPIFSNPAYADYIITSGDEGQSVFGSLRQSLSDDVEVFANAGHSERSSAGESHFPMFGTSQNWVSENRNTNAVLGVDLTLPRDWTAEVAASGNRQQTEAIRRYPGVPTTDDVEVANYETLGLEASATGSLFTLPAGSVFAALGGGYRHDTYSHDGIYITPERSLELSYAFAELRVPVIGPSAGGTDPRLVLSLAGRYDDYGDYGSSADPRIGLEFTAFPGLKLRGAYSTSFRAPTLEQSDTSADQIYIWAYPGYGTIADRAVDPELGPETSTNFSAGLVFEPPSVAGLRVELNWYDIKYRNRIGNPPSFCVYGPTFCTGGAVNDPANANLILLRGEIPDAEFDALVAEYLSGGRGQIRDYCVLFGFACAPNVPSSFNAIYRQGTLNLASTHESGVDLKVRQVFTFDDARLELGVDATYIFELERQITEGSPSIDYVNTVYEPVQMRLRGAATWSGRAWTLGGYVNHIGEHTNTFVSPNQEIPAWTTIDLMARVKLSPENSSSLLNGVELIFNVANVLDDLPPPIPDGANFTYDTANGEPWGRVVSFSITKSW